MTAWIDQYPYLFAVLLGVPPVLVGFAVAPDQRGMMMISGLALTAFAPFLILFEGSYWAPPRITTTFPGIEDLIMNFSIGSLTWLFAVAGVRRALEIDLDWAVFLKRFAIIAGLNVAILLLLNAFGLSIMISHIIAGVVVLAFLLVRYPAVKIIVGWYAVLYPPYYFLILFTAGAFSDTFFQMWNGPALLGPRLMGMPIEEVLWPFSFASYPYGVAYAVNARISRSR